MSDTIESTVAPYARLINVLTDEYNMTLADLKRTYRHIMWGDSVTESFLAEIGFAVVQPTIPPSDGDYYEVAPIITDGVYYMAWELRPYDPADVAAKLSAAKDAAKVSINEFVDQALARGTAFNFNTAEEPNVQHIQMRDTDRINVIGLSKKSERTPELNQYFRTYENNLIAVSNAMISDINDAAYAGYVAVKTAQWTYLDLVSAAVDKDSIPAPPASLQDFYRNFANLTWSE